jgi:hypothetical protein
MPIANRSPRALFSWALAAALALVVATPAGGRAEAAGEKDPLASIAWLAGEWVGDDAGVLNEERWTEPAGGMMLGVHRDISGGKAISFEFLRIQATPDGIIYWASPRGDHPTPFPVTENGEPKGEQKIVFANPDIEYPTRILYWLGKGGELHARIEGTPAGTPKFKEWVWKRRK